MLDRGSFSDWSLYLLSDRGVYKISTLELTLYGWKTRWC